MNYQNQITTRTCPNCNSLISAETNFCTTCGQIVLPSNTNYKKGQKHKKPIIMITICVICVAIIISSCFILVKINQNSNGLSISSDEDIDYTSTSNTPEGTITRFLNALSQCDLRATLNEYPDFALKLETLDADLTINSRDIMIENLAIKESRNRKTYNIEKISNFRRTITFKSIDLFYRSSEWKVYNKYKDIIQIPNNVQVYLYCFDYIINSEVSSSHIFVCKIDGIWYSFRSL